MRFPNKMIFFLAISLAMGVCVPLILYTRYNNDGFQMNGFERQFKSINPILSSSEILNLGYNGYYISGYTEHHLFLSHKEAPAHVLMTNLKLADTTHINLEISIENKGLSSFKGERLKVVIDSPEIYMTDGPSGTIIKGTLSNSNIEKKKYNNFAFGHHIQISASTSVFKSYDLDIGQSKLVKKDKDPATSPKFIFEKQIEGVFCCDGMLLYNKTNSQLLHVYYYRNQLICLDTMLRTLYISKTIDTITRAQIEPSYIKSGTERTLGNVPFAVNRRSCVFKEYLYINSTIKGDNENAEIFKKNSAIDIYSTKNGLYLFSLYIPRYQGKEVRYFQVIGSTLYALYQKHLVSYSLNFANDTYLSE